MTFGAPMPCALEPAAAAAAPPATLMSVGIANPALDMHVVHDAIASLGGAITGGDDDGVYVAFPTRVTGAQLNTRIRDMLGGRVAAPPPAAQRQVVDYLRRHAGLGGGGGEPAASQHLHALARNAAALRYETAAGSGDDADDAADELPRGEELESVD